MKKSFDLFLLLCFFAFFQVSVAQPSIAKSKVLSLIIYTTDTVPKELQRFFDTYLQDAYALPYQNEQQFKKNFHNFINLVDKDTLVTLYYHGFGVSENDKNYLISQVQQHANSSGVDLANSLILTNDILRPILRQQPKGLFVFYDAKALAGGHSAVVNKAVSDAAVFYPKQGVDFINLPSVGQALLSMDINAWQAVNPSNFNLNNQLDYERFSEYCLQPHRSTGCKKFINNATVTNPVQNGCTSPVTITQHQGRLAVVDLTVSSSCRANQEVSVLLHHYYYSARLNAEGKAVIPLYPIHSKSVAKVIFKDGEEVSYTITAKEVDEVSRVILSWEGSVQLDLHVLPPRAKLNSNADIWRGNACDKKVKLKRNERFDCSQGSQNKSMNMQVYTRALPLKKKLGHRQIITFRVDYFTRGSQALAPYCGEKKLAKMNYSIQHITGDNARRARKLAFNAVPCGRKVDNRYYTISEKVNIQ